MEWAKKKKKWRLITLISQYCGTVTLSPSAKSCFKIIVFKINGENTLEFLMENNSNS